MVFGLSKNKYSGEYIKYIAAIPLITSCCYAGFKDIQLKTDEDIAHLRCMWYEKICIAGAMKYVFGEENQWIKKDEYKDSIYNVITTALADCILHINEFADDKIKDGVVTFDNKDYKTYTAENWNALVFYNYIKYLEDVASYMDSRDGILYIDSYDDTHYIRGFYDNIIKKGLLSKVCGEEYAQKIEEAYHDIVEYDKILDLLRLGRDTKHEVYSNEATYDLGEGKYRRIRYDMAMAFNATSMSYKDNEYLALEIANNKIERILSYNKDGVDEIELNDYMKIESRKKVYDLKTDTGEATIDLSKKLTDIDPTLILEWYEDDKGIHICKLKEDKQLINSEYTRSENDFKRERKLKIIASGPYIKRQGDHKEVTQKKPIILEKQCFKGVEGCTEYSLRMDIELCNQDKSIILPNDCNNLFSYSPAIESIKLIGLTVNSTNLNDLCTYCTNLKKVNIFIKENPEETAPKLTSIEGMLKNNSRLEEATVRIKATQITNMRQVFAGCEACKKISLYIKETNPPEKRDMTNMFAANKELEIIDWGDTAWRQYITAGTIDEIFSNRGDKTCELGVILGQIQNQKTNDTLILDRTNYHLLAYNRCS